MPALTVYTDPLVPGICQMPVFTVGDDQNWSIQFNNGTNFYNPTGVYMRLGFITGLVDGTYGSAFAWNDRLNNRHVGSFSITSAVPSAITWDENPLSVQGGSGVYLIQGRVPPSSGVRKVYVLNGGSGLSATPSVAFYGGAAATGFGATATAGRGGGTTLSSITITNSGWHYSVTPRIVISGGGGSGATAAVTTLTDGRVVNVTIYTAGSGYTSDPTVTFVDPEGDITASISASSAVASVALGNGGSGYTSAPTVAITGGGGASATATATIAASSWPITTLLTITNQGSGYTSAPTVAFSGGSGSGAAATATINDPSGVQAVTVTSGGSYYSQNRTGTAVTFSGGGGTGAAGYIVVGNESGKVESVVITNSGGGYTSTPTVTFPTANSGSDATGTAVRGDGKVATLTVTNVGSGYTSAPTVGFSGGGGSGAAATSAVTGSPVIGLTLTAAGSGYTSVPTVGFSGGAGTGATATATLSLGITAITVGQSGYAYTSTPSVTVAPPCDAQFQVAGIETNTYPYLREFSPATAQQAITATPYSTGRRNSAGTLVYDNSLLLIRPRILLSPTLTLQNDALTWAGVFNPVVAWVTALLGYRRTAVVDIEIFGGGRLLYTGALAIQSAAQ